MRQWFVAGMGLCLSACGGSPYGDHPPNPAAGQILVNGKPVKMANIVLFHDGDWGTKTVVPSAWTDDEGRFKLSTYAAGDGAPAGDYKVIVEWFPHRKGKDDGADALGGKYANRTNTPLKAHIEKGPNELKFELEISQAQVKANEALDAKYAAGKVVRNKRADR